GSWGRPRGRCGGEPVWDGAGAGPRADGSSTATTTANAAGLWVSMRVMPMSATPMVRGGGTVGRYLDRRQRIGRHEITNVAHRFIGRSEASHCRMLRSRILPRVGASGLDAPAGMGWYVETDDAIRAVRTVRIGRVFMWRGRVLNRVGSIRHMPKRGMAISVVVGRPGADDAVRPVEKRDLVRRSVES